jgi:hypothetical protein
MMGVILTGSILNFKPFEKASPEIPPGLPFPKGGVVLYGNSLNNGAFSSFEKEG